jgi:hypothetical protein
MNFEHHCRYLALYARHAPPRLPRHRIARRDQGRVPQVTVARAAVSPRRFQSTSEPRPRSLMTPIPPSSASRALTTVLGKTFQRDEWTNATPTILSKVGRNLHLQEGHPCPRCAASSRTTLRGTSLSGPSRRS